MTMRQYFILLALALFIGACQGRAVNSDKVAPDAVVNQASDADAVASRVQEIYDAVFKEYNLEDSLRNLDQLEGLGAYAHRSEFNRNFCSKEWNELVNQIDEIDSLYHAEEMGFWDADYWIMGQDWHNLSISDIEVLAVTPSEAAVQFNLHNFDSTGPVTLRLVNEDGVWKIDDFLDVDNDHSWKKSMQEYVKEEIARIEK